MTVAVFQATEMCVECRGACCTHMPGAAFPADCGDDIEAGLRVKLQSGDYILDYWEGSFEGSSEDKLAYYLRPRTVAERDLKYPRNGTWGGRCTFHTDSGCKLKFEERPLNCRAVKPKEDEGSTCGVEYGSKTDSIREWLEHNALIEKVLEDWNSG